MVAGLVNFQENKKAGRASTAGGKKKKSPPFK